MEILKKHKKQILFHLIINVLIGIFITYASYYHTPLHSNKAVLLYTVHFLIIQFSIFGFMYFISINKYIFYLFFTIVFFSFSIFSFGIFIQDISVTDSIIHAIMETKFDIAIDLITPLSFFYCLFISILILYVLKLRNNLHCNQIKSPLIYLAILGVLSYFITENKKENTLDARMPYSLVKGLYTYSNKKEIKTDTRKIKLQSNLNAPNIVFILGESVRADHLQLNGYARNTTPKLNSRSNIISFSKMYTPLTYTGISVPQILTNLSIDRSIPESVYSIYTILNNLNYTTIWIGNQTPEKSFISYIEENDSIHLLDPFHSSFSFQKKKDLELIPYFKKIYNPIEKQFITIHMIGSHWWYESRYTDNFKNFKPTIRSKHIGSNTSNQMINSYDNTLLYLDNFMNEIITELEKKNTNTLLIYVSDHGEMLGENGKWLHAQEDESIKNPAVILWYSNKFQEKNSTLVKKLINKKNKKINYDFFYHSILNIMEVQGIEYNIEESIFNN